MTGAIERRLVVLENRRRPAPSYVVQLPSDADIQDPEAVAAAIADHQRRTGWMGPVILAPAEMTVEEWVAKYGRAGGV